MARIGMYRHKAHFSTLCAHGLAKGWPLVQGKLREKRSPPVSGGLLDFGSYRPVVMVQLVGMMPPF